MTILPLKSCDIKIHDVIQGSEEWHSLRIGKITGSGFSKLLGCKSTKERYLYNRANERVTKCRCDGDEYPGNIHTRRGHEFEPVIRQRYIDFHIKQFIDPMVRVVGLVQLGEYIAYSPDGLVGDDGLIEIKVPDSNNYFRQILEIESKGIDAIPTDYYMQMQFGMYVCKRSWCDYLPANPKHEKNNKGMRIYRVYRDEEVQQKIEATLEENLAVIDQYVERYNNLGDLI